MEIIIILTGEIIIGARIKIGETMDKIKVGEIIQTTIKVGVTIKETKDGATNQIITKAMETITDGDFVSFIFFIYF